MPEQAWIKSSYSGSQANCVEVAVRDRVAAGLAEQPSGRVRAGRRGRGEPRPGRAEQQQQEGQRAAELLHRAILRR